MAKVSSSSQGQARLCNLGQPAPRLLTRPCVASQLPEGTPVLSLQQRACLARPCCKYLTAYRCRAPCLLPIPLPPTVPRRQHKCVSAGHATQWPFVHLELPGLPRHLWRAGEPLNPREAEPAMAPNLCACENGWSATLRSRAREPRIMESYSYCGARGSCWRHWHTPGRITEPWGSGARPSF